MLGHLALERVSYAQTSSTIDGYPNLTGYRVVGVEIKGISRTNKEWLLGYLDFSFPLSLSQDGAEFVKRKLLTTSVFTDVRIAFIRHPSEDDSYLLVIEVEEKWTTIPVLRGAYGGGTPLVVLGGYDIHTAGRLWTIGAEARKYGDAPPGYVVYVRDPRHSGDRFFLGAELWRMFRQRDLFDRKGGFVNSVTTSTTRVRANFLAPWSGNLPIGNRFAWKYGLNLEFMQESEADERHLRILPTLVHDNVDVGVIQMDGLRVKVQAGPSLEREKNHSVVEMDAFYYWLATGELNLAAHWYFAQTSSTSFESMYFLGGFESVRGLPEGIIYGSHASYINLEARMQMVQWRYLWTESVFFYDEGFAGNNFTEAWADRRSAVGVGMRFAVPQVHRLMFRIDYAWSVDGSGTQGLSAGLNQFFDPYRPL